MPPKKKLRPIHGLTSRVKRLENKVSRVEAETIIRCQDNNQVAIGSTNGTLIELTSLGSLSGEKIKVTGFNMHKIFQHARNPTIDYDMIRVIVCRSKKGALTTADFPRWYACVDREKMAVMYDKTHSIHSNGSDTAVYHGFTTSQVNMNKFYKRGSSVLYDGGLTSTSNGIYLFMISALSSSTTQSGYVSLFYTDA